MPWGLGGGGWGLGPWGAGFLSLPSARAVAENRIRATFDLPLNLSGLLVIGDALRPQNYLVTPGSGSRAVAVVACEEVSGDDSSVDLVVDRPLSSSPLRYALRALNVLSELGLPLDPSAPRAEFPGQLQGRRLPAGEAGHAGPPARGGAGDAGLAAGRRHGGLRVRRGDREPAQAGAAPLRHEAGGLLPPAEVRAGHPLPAQAERDPRAAAQAAGRRE